MTELGKNAPRSGGVLKRSGLSGLAIGTLAVFACELPLLIVALGLGGVAGFGWLADFNPPPALEIIGFVILALSWAALIALFIRNRHNCRRQVVQ